MPPPPLRARRRRLLPVAQNFAVAALLLTTTCVVGDGPEMCVPGCNACGDQSTGGYNWYQTQSTAGADGGPSAHFTETNCGCCGGTLAQKETCKQVCVNHHHHTTEADCARVGETLLFGACVHKLTVQTCDASMGVHDPAKHTRGTPGGELTVTANGGITRWPRRPYTRNETCTTTFNISTQVTGQETTVPVDFRSPTNNNVTCDVSSAESFTLRYASTASSATSILTTRSTMMNSVLFEPANTHGRSNGDFIKYEQNGVTAITGLATGGSYYVVNRDTGGFQLSATKGGAYIYIDGGGAGNKFSTTDERAWCVQKLQLLHPVKVLITRRTWFWPGGLAQCPEAQITPASRAECAASLTKIPGPAAPPTTGPPVIVSFTKKCTDVSSWLANNGHTCKDYEDRKWCTPEGGYGTGWPGSHLSFSTFANNGVDASQACCACGAMKAASTGAFASHTGVGTALDISPTAVWGGNVTSWTMQLGNDMSLGVIDEPSGLEGCQAIVAAGLLRPGRYRTANDCRNALIARLNLVRIDGTYNTVTSLQGKSDAQLVELARRVGCTRSIFALNEEERYVDAPSDSPSESWLPKSDCATVYTEADARVRAKQLGLQLGGGGSGGAFEGGGSEFASGDYTTKGLYYYGSDYYGTTWRNTAFFGTGGTNSQMEFESSAGSKKRPGCPTAAPVAAACETVPVGLQMNPKTGTISGMPLGTTCNMSGSRLYERNAIENVTLPYSYDLAPVGTMYEHVATALGEYCPNGDDITTEAECAAAAAAFGLTFVAAFDGPGDHKNCLNAPQHGTPGVYFNTAAVPGDPLPTYSSLCSAVPDPAAGTDDSYIVYENGGCAGRNELGSGEETLSACRTLCNDDASCISFEYRDGAGSDCLRSTTCTGDLRREDGTGYRLYVKTPTHKRSEEMYFPASSGANACRDACTANDECRAYTVYHESSKNESSNGCRLHKYVFPPPGPSQLASGAWRAKDFYNPQVEWCATWVRVPEVPSCSAVDVNVTATNGAGSHSTVVGTITVIEANAPKLEALPPVVRIATPAGAPLASLSAAFLIHNLVAKAAPESGSWSAITMTLSSASASVFDPASHGLTFDGRSGLLSLRTTTTNFVTENAPGIGGFGGSCTCPDGTVYQTGDNGNSCGSLACVGGVSGTCNAESGPWSNRKVICAYLRTRPTTTNVVTENAPGTGGFGGSCTCPDGTVYQTGDNGNSCGSLACVGGVSGTCNAESGPWSNRKVICAYLTVDAIGTNVTRDEHKIRDTLNFTITASNTAGVSAPVFFLLAIVEAPLDVVGGLRYDAISVVAGTKFVPIRPAYLHPAFMKGNVKFTYAGKSTPKVADVHVIAGAYALPSDPNHMSSKFATLTVAPGQTSMNNYGRPELNMIQFYTTPHERKVGDAIKYTQKTGAIIGLEDGSTYYVHTVHGTIKFTLAAYVGGPELVLSGDASTIGNTFTWSLDNKISGTWHGALTVGSSQNNRKSVSCQKCSGCKDIKDHKNADTWRFEYSDTELTAIRSDSSVGWGHTLKVDCNTRPAFTGAITSATAGTMVFPDDSTKNAFTYTKDSGYLLITWPVNFGKGQPFVWAKIDQFPDNENEEGDDEKGGDEPAHHHHLNAGDTHGIFLNTTTGVVSGHVARPTLLMLTIVVEHIGPQQEMLISSATLHLTVLPSYTTRGAGSRTGIRAQEEPEAVTRARCATQRNGETLPFNYTYIVYENGGCAGRNELETKRVTLSTCRTLCNDDASCISFEYPIVDPNESYEKTGEYPQCQRSTTCTDDLSKKSPIPTWRLYVKKESRPRNYGGNWSWTCDELRVGADHCTPPSNCAAVNYCPADSSMDPSTGLCDPWNPSDGMERVYDRLRGRNGTTVETTMPCVKVYAADGVAYQAAVLESQPCAYEWTDCRGCLSYNATCGLPSGQGGGKVICGVCNCPRA